MSQQSSPAVKPRVVNRFGRELGYNLSAIFTGSIAFSIAIALFSAGISTIIIYVGVFILLGALYSATAFAAIERNMASWATGQLPPTYYKRSDSASKLRRVLSPLTDAQRWKDLLHAVVSFPVRVLAFSVTISWIAAALGGLTQWYWDRFLPEANTELWDLLDIDARYHVWLQLVLGLFFLATLPAIVRGLALLQRVLAVGLLTNERQALREEAKRLSASRSSAIAAEAGTLRKIERDIHDGPQQRMVRMNMDLEAAKRKLDPHDQATLALLDSALEQSQGALTELRALSRGIAPPVLSDRGLIAALEAAAGRSPVPVTFQVNPDVPPRLPTAVEDAAYFAGLESLTNVAKHSHATHCQLALDVTSDGLWLRIHDNGVGGAHLGKGTGLAGLVDRLAGVDGTLNIESSPERGTEVTVFIPWHDSFEESVFSCGLNLEMCELL
ncbi:histidine kinase [Arthrobacter sp. MYb227]|uniref:sensor histidine kinase n=1 Tax=Arthrobacter sp. MYb227 TaxID=1848601 RepID=UPI000CFDAD87|nr:sensor domain-containing protein [Arthrobacter sp. MYb227]PQZ89591.1 histidine kinase [Arthrobacter sp. MYb227]